MPSSRERFIRSLISPTLPLKMRSDTSGEFSITSTAGTRPLPSRRGISRCATNARTLSDRSISSCARRSSGKKLMIRSSAWLELFACRVPRHRCPVSANATAWSLVLRILQGHLPGLRVDAHLALGDEAVLVVVHVLDRIFDSDDVAVTVFVAV